MAEKQGRARVIFDERVDPALNGLDESAQGIAWRIGARRPAITRLSIVAPRSILSNRIEDRAD